MAEKPAYGGYSIARVDDKVTFIEGAIPGETAEIEITVNKSEYSYAVAKKILETSPDRIIPVCPYFGVCGGCSYQYISTERQISLKDEIISDALRRIGKMEVSLSPALTDCSWNYRHRAKIQFSKTGDIGFFRKSSREVVPIDACPLLHADINLLLQNMMSLGPLTGVADIVITSGKSQIALITGGNNRKLLRYMLNRCGLSGMAFDDKPANGKNYAEFQLNGMKYTVSPSTFIQSHWKMNSRLVDHLIAAMAPLAGKKVLDLYAGAGNFSLPAARAGARVTAVESSAAAFSDGLRNMELNGIDSCRFIQMPSESFTINDEYDIIILDPPRQGAAPAVMNMLLSARPDMLIYISCDPSTLARDLIRLSGTYRIDTIRQINFFPQTHHIETAAFLRRI